jgi:hypothetical protein
MISLFLFPLICKQDGQRLSRKKKPEREKQETCKPASKNACRPSESPLQPRTRQRQVHRKVRHGKSREKPERAKRRNGESRYTHHTQDKVDEPLVKRHSRFSKILTVRRNAGLPDSRRAFRCTVNIVVPLAHRLPRQPEPATRVKSGGWRVALTNDFS